MSKASVRAGKALTESKYSFLLEPYENGAPAPTLLQSEVSVADASPFLLTNPDFSQMDVVKAFDYLVDFYSKSNRLSISIFTVIVIDIVALP